MYPFAGRECARAFALMSTDTADCHDNLEGLNSVEMESLREWEAKFMYKYPIVGKVVS
jgi:membrane-associated progesterone receptor component